jgi:hypothetical protein
MTRERIEGYIVYALAGVGAGDILVGLIRALAGI